MRTIGRYAFRIVVALLTLGILVIGGFLVIVAVPDITNRTAVDPSARPTVAPSSSPRSAMGLSPVGIEMPGDADCAGCHQTSAGGVGTKPIPVMGHPLAGWRDCTACHSETTLVKTAPGHSSLHKEDCLICHKTRTEAGVASSAPKTRPEHMGRDKPCLSCHGIDQHAPLPPSMVGRGENCWICHNGPEYQYLFESAKPGAATPTPAPTEAPGSAAPSEPPASVLPPEPASDDPAGWVFTPIW
jgi:hypothetical protein